VLVAFVIDISPVIWSVHSLLLWFSLVLLLAWHAGSEAGRSEPAGFRSGVG